MMTRMTSLAVVLGLSLAGAACNSASTASSENPGFEPGYQTNLNAGTINDKNRQLEGSAASLNVNNGQMDQNNNADQSTNNRDNMSANEGE